MYLRKILMLASVLLLTLSIAGCGSEGNSNTNGTLTLTTSPTEPKGGSLTLKATATVVSGRDNAVTVGLPVTITVTQYGTDPSSGLVVSDLPVSSGELKTASGGIAAWSYVFPQKTYDTTLQVVARSGGLIETSSVNVPKLVVTL